VGRVKSLFTSCISIRDGWSASSAVDMSTSQKVCATRSNTLQHTALHGFFQLQHVSKSKRVCNTLQHAATCCNMLQHAATRCNTLQHAATRCHTLPHAAIRCSTLQHAATHGFHVRWRYVCKSKRVCNTLQHSATPCNTLQHPATLCDTLQHSATPCNTLQHPATCCNTLHHPATPSHRRFRTKRDLFHYLTYPRHMNISKETCIHKHQTCKRDL